MHALGIDIGGTGMKAAPVDLDTGTFLADRVKIATPRPAVPDTVAEVVQKLVETFSWSGPIGITFPGVVTNGVTRTAANLHKTWTRLREIQQTLQRRAAGRVKGGKKPTVATVRKQVQQALTRQFMKTLFRYDIQEVSGVPTLTYETDGTALSRLIRVQLGKTILFTDNDDWSTEEIVRSRILTSSQRLQLSM